MNRGLPRWFDVALAALVLGFGAPAWIGVAAAVALSSPGPVLYRSRRVGRDGIEFDMLKFRTMRTGTDGPRVTMATDDRITRVGRLLRLSKLDEIPQLVNVLRGEMSLVGPRPEDPSLVCHDDPDHRALLTVRPGLTSRASIEYRFEERILAAAEDPHIAYRDVVQPAKVAIDRAWLDDRSMAADVRVLIDTARAVFTRPSPPPADQAD